MIRFKINDMIFIPHHIFRQLFNKHQKKRKVSTTVITPLYSCPTLDTKKKTKRYVPYVANTNFYAQLQGLEKLFGKPLFYSGSDI